MALCMFVVYQSNWTLTEFRGPSRVCVCVFVAVGEHCHIACDLNPDTVQFISLGTTTSIQGLDSGFSLEDAATLLQKDPKPLMVASCRSSFENSASTFESKSRALHIKCGR